MLSQKVHVSFVCVCDRERGRKCVCMCFVSHSNWHAERREGIQDDLRIAPSIKLFLFFSEVRKRFATKGKMEPSRETIAILRQALKYDYELYLYIKQRFYELGRKYMRRFINPSNR